MPLPYSRNETATPATPPRSATMNDLQDMIVRLATNPVTRYIDAAAMQPAQNGTAPLLVSGGTGVVWYGASGVTSLLVPLDLDVGDTLVSWYLAAFKGSPNTVTLTAQLVRSPIANSSAVALVPGSAAVTNAAAAPGQITLGRTENHVVADGFTYRIAFSFGTGNANDYVEGAKRVAVRVFP